MTDKRAYYYKHDRLTPKQERENEALILKLLQERQEKEQPCNQTPTSK